MLAGLNCLLISKINVLHELQHIKDKLKLGIEFCYYFIIYLPIDSLITAPRWAPIYNHTAGFANL